MTELSRRSVEVSQWKLVRALLMLLQRHHAQPAVVFGSCVRVLTQQRTLSLDSRAKEQLFVTDWSDMIDMPPLLVEMVT